jgi:hypothetical protein
MNRYSAMAGIAAAMLITGYLLPKPEPSRPRPPEPAAVPAPPPKPTLTPADQQSYERELTYLRDMGAVNLDAGKQMQALGALERAEDYFRQASRNAALARCLSDERSRVVPFYEAKARCRAAES